MLMLVPVLVVEQDVAHDRINTSAPTKYTKTNPTSTHDRAQGITGIIVTKRPYNTWFTTSCAELV